ncbi:peptide ABC transporter substrate-binding protein [Aquamicrobium sp. LC103]|uniref:peptide ABC transporter substrate-binding protein n=1 Tax=Aquamicrobium sp. LC103 TaxID=1120658 RepID=UPI00063EB8F2|nr:peptide ABC transporter substrate-binding protein [Aquamicrobium sp. LC103]TKT79039.1 peptide ABC transporter substrate-binding protein [Aquamicrobium sp. LC103]
MKKMAMALAAGVAALSLGAGAAKAERGSDGNLNILYWQAVSILNPFLSGGIKDVEASSIVIEPLAKYDETGQMVPALVDEIPTLANGGISEDLKSITWKIKEGVVWSDGTPLTAHDVAFTAQYCMAPDGGCQQLAKFTDVEKVEAVDDQTVKVTFSVAKPFPYGPFVGKESPIIQKAQFENCVGPKAPECTAQNFGPIGTGPFRVVDFKANDVVTFEANPNYRDPAKPAFATVMIKGGGDPTSAARAVLETGEFDYAWNLQVEPEILAQMEAVGKGVIVTSFGTSVERIEVNLTDPSPDKGADRSTRAGGEHPFLKDPAVRKALSLAIDRELLVEAGYGAAGKPTCNILPAPENYASTGVDWCLKQDVEAANKLLDDAGWVPGADGIRAKDGVRLSVLYQTSTNSVRQATQALVKDMWAQIGVETELRNIDAAVFFGADPSSPDTLQKFYADLEMYTNNFPGTDPEGYMAGWLCSNIPNPDNNWLGTNQPRFCNEEYDALVHEMAKTADLAERGELAKKMNDILSNEGALIPLIHRGEVAAHSVTVEGMRMNSWDSQVWNIADWTRKK